MMKIATLAIMPALAAAHGNMLYPYAWWDANGTGRPRPRAPQQRACPSAGLAATPTRGRAGLEAASSPQESVGTASDLPSEQPSRAREREQSTVQNLSDVTADRHGYRSCSQ